MKLNEHILLVMKWLDDNDSVSKEELKENRESAVTYANAITCCAFKSPATYAAYATATYAYDAYAAAAAAYATDAVEIWLSKFFQEPGHEKQDYIDALEREKI